MIPATLAMLLFAFSSMAAKRSVNLLGSSPASLLRIRLSGWRRRRRGSWCSSIPGFFGVSGGTSRSGRPQGHPGGMKAISRGLSVAIPPVTPRMQPHPGRGASKDRTQRAAGTPPGCRPLEPLLRGCRCAHPPANGSHPFRMQGRAAAPRGRVDEIGEEPNGGTRSDKGVHRLGNLESSGARPAFPA